MHALLAWPQRDHVATERAVLLGGGFEVAPDGSRQARREDRCEQKDGRALGDDGEHHRGAISGLGKPNRLELSLMKRNTSDPTAMSSAVGNVSFDEWLMLTSSFG